MTAASMSPLVWFIEWSHGRAWIESTGAMLGPVEFLLPSGRVVQPFATFPWADEALPADQEPLTGLMARGRGDWPCVPFGRDEGTNSIDSSQPPHIQWRHPIHGAAAHGIWQLVRNDGDSIVLRYEFETSAPIAKLERELIGLPHQAAVLSHLRIFPRKNCFLPIGLHPCLRLSPDIGASVLTPPEFAFGASYPAAVEPGFDTVLPAQFFDNLQKVRRNQDSTNQQTALNLTRFPLPEQTESLVQLCGIKDGTIDFTNTTDAYRFTLKWDAKQLPSCVLWISNGGRGVWPWNHRHYALGIEPVNAAFDLGINASLDNNSISRRGVETAFHFVADQTVTISHTMAVTDV